MLVQRAPNKKGDWASLQTPRALWVIEQEPEEVRPCGFMCVPRLRGNEDRCRTQSAYVVCPLSSLCLWYQLHPPPRSLDHLYFLSPTSSCAISVSLQVHCSSCYHSKYLAFCLVTLAYYLHQQTNPQLSRTVQSWTGFQLSQLSTATYPTG